MQKETTSSWRSLYARDETSLIGQRVLKSRETGQQFRKIRKFESYVPSMKIKTAENDAGLQTQFEDCPSAFGSRDVMILIGFVFPEATLEPMQTNGRCSSLCISQPFT